MAGNIPSFWLLAYRRWFFCRARSRSSEVQLGEQAVGLRWERISNSMAIPIVAPAANSGILPWENY